LTLPFRLLLISDGADRVERALRAADDRVALLVRDREAPVDVVRGRCARLRARWSGRLIVHSQPGVARAYDGLHLADGVATPRYPGMIGASRHAGAPLDDDDLARLAYAMLGPVFAPNSKPLVGEALGLDGLREACARATRPVVAVGGVDAANARDCLDAGASAVAVIGAVRDADDPATALRALLAAV
jgi:thiamine-phosphate pyrophosphorylase